MKKVLLSLAVIIVILVIAVFIVPKDYAVEKAVVINQPRTKVFQYVRFLKNQDNFSVWAKADPHMRKDFRGVDGTVGFVSAWDSDSADVGQGEQEIIKITAPGRIDFELRFKKPFESTDQAYMMTDSLDSTHTRVKWGFNGSMPRPMNLMLLFVDMEKELSPMLSDGLVNLKAILEK